VLPETAIEVKRQISSFSRHPTIFICMITFIPEAAENVNYYFSMRRAGLPK